MTDKPITFVSVHGGHSAEFCSHAEDTLEEIIGAYVELGFSWVGITEHMPSIRDALVPDEERDAGLDAKAMYERFSRYITTCRDLQRKHASTLEILVGFETDTCEGYESFVENLTNEFRPDYIVGSVHHVGDVSIDTSRKLYDQAAENSGGINGLYCEYFDQQYEMVRALRPAVVGHFDLIRIFDPDYRARIERPDIWQRIERNLVAIAELDLILDFNVRAMTKGQSEPYITPSILQRALDLEIAVVPGDDSHGVRTVGHYYDEGIRMLRKIGFDIDWRKPV